MRSVNESEQSFADTLRAVELQALPSADDAVPAIDRVSDLHHWLLIIRKQKG